MRVLKKILGFLFSRFLWTLIGIVVLCALITVALAWWVPGWNMLAMMGVALPWRGPQPKPAA